MYKQGQAGINKATVTITFDNRDKKHGPIGYHHCDEITIRRQVKIVEWFSLNTWKVIYFFQIIVNGRNSYTINGSTATNSKVLLPSHCHELLRSLRSHVFHIQLYSIKVSDFFRSVGLNVNNPHFLIMQGRITKVLNMKPHEVSVVLLFVSNLPVPEFEDFIAIIHCSLAFV